MAGMVRQQPSAAARTAESAFERHQRMIAEAVRLYGDRIPEASAPPPVKTDKAILHETYRFVREEADDADGGWEVRLARRYYSQLFREYCIADLSLYKEGKIGMRWRTRKEVVAGRGQFICGAKGCDERRGLESFEVNLGYLEAGVRKNALVKLRVCPAHALQLNYKKDKEVLKVCYAIHARLGTPPKALIDARRNVRVTSLFMLKQFLCLPGAAEAETTGK